MIPVFVISTPNDAARTQNYENQFKAQGIEEFEIIPATMYPKQPCTGIAKSHKAAVRIAKERNYPEVIIAEDDLMFLHPGAYRRFLDICEEVPPHVNIVLGCFYDGTPHPITDKIAKIEGKISGLIFYVIRSNYYDKFLEADEIYNIDYWISSPEFGNANIWSTYPMICLQQDNFFSYNTKQVVKYNEYHGARYRLWDGKD